MASTSGVSSKEFGYIESESHGLLPCAIRPKADGDRKRLFFTTLGDDETIDVTDYKVIYFLPELNQNYWEGTSAFSGIPAVEDLSDAANPIAVMLDVSEISGDHHFTCGTDASSLGVWCYR